QDALLEVFATIRPASTHSIKAQPALLINTHPCKRHSIATLASLKHSRKRARALALKDPRPVVPTINHVINRSVEFNPNLPRHPLMDGTQQACLNAEC